MHPFRYTKVLDETSACAAASAEEQVVFIAGGTSLIDLMKLDVQTPTHLIDINDLPLANIEIRDDGARIGALARNSDVAFHPVLQQRYPVLTEALLAGASPQLRNAATIGGNLMQRTRCSYFRDSTTPCNKREPGSGCSAINGYNRMHALLGTSRHCIATHPSDMCVALVALDAVIHTRGPKGERRIPITDFYLEPGDHPERETVLEQEELIVAIHVPETAFARRSHYIKVRDRSSHAFALASVGAALTIQNGRVQEARIALGGVATKPWRAYEAEQALSGKEPGQEAYEAAASAAIQGAVPQTDNGFKVELVRRTVVRTLMTVGGMR
ncbi:MAG TPA: xanthine dehydrogenase family protein subunit M [Ktedonobacteraceae bacterium]